MLNLLARWKRTLRPPPPDGVPQLVVLAQGAQTITTLMIAAFHQDWTIRFALSLCGAMALLRKAPTIAVVHDWDSHAYDWRELCDACIQCGVPFFLVAGRPPDDLFLAVVGAGGAGVLWKPFRAEQLVTAIGAARSLAASVRSLSDPNVLRCE